MNISYSGGFHEDIGYYQDEQATLCRSVNCHEEEEEANSNVVKENKDGRRKKRRRRKKLLKYDSCQGRKWIKPPQAVCNHSHQ